MGQEGISNEMTFEQLYGSDIWGKSISEGLKSQDLEVRVNY